MRNASRQMSKPFGAMVLCSGFGRSGSSRGFGS